MSDIRVGSGYGVGAVTLAGDAAAGEGGPHDARLVLPLTVTMHSRPIAEMLALTELIGSLHLVSPGGFAWEQNQFGMAFSVNLTEGMHCRSQDAPASCRVELRFPMDGAHVAALEAHRHKFGGGDFSATLRLRGTVVWLKQTGNSFSGMPDPTAISDHPFLPGMGMFSLLVPFWDTRIDDLTVQIPRSVWVEKVLPGLGLDRLRLIEIVLPTSGGPLPSEVIAHFDAARRDHDAGRYRECVEKCRYVRHAVEQHLGATPKVPVEEVIGQRLGWPAGAPQQAFLGQGWKALVHITNEAHHPAGGGDLRAPDARACLLATAVLIEYLERLMGP